ncbi:polysaccharide deacetylase family protein [Salininema proteolyticum]|uniref:Polysaccharide deacetylase family protein n=1 Tax=Salininema proteolyticum TaxID=1607685 RepID=A0ABV8TW41_9ACTN
MAKGTSTAVRVARRPWAAAALAAVLVAAVVLGAWVGGSLRTPEGRVDPPVDAAPAASPDGAHSAAPEAEQESPPAEGEGAAEETAGPDPDRDPGLYKGPNGTLNKAPDDRIAFTFDDGPVPEWSDKVLDLLADEGVEATFCLIGQYAEDHPDVVRRIAEEGHGFCNHAWYHEQKLGTESEKTIRANMERTNEAIREAAGEDVAIGYYRQPGGQWTDRVIGVGRDLGMEPLHWTVDPGDWNPEVSHSSIAEHVLERAGPGSIILLHDGAANQKDMMKALKAIIEEFKDRGYEFGAL